MLHATKAQAGTCICCHGKHMPILPCCGCRLPPIATDPYKAFGLQPGKKLAPPYILYRGLAFQSPAWQRCSFVPVILTEIYRQDDKWLADTMNLIRCPVRPRQQCSNL